LCKVALASKRKYFLKKSSVFGTLSRRGGRKKMASEQLSAADTMLAGALARVVAQGVLHPLDVVRTRRQVKDLRGSVYEFRAMAYGLSPQLLLSGPAGAIQFTTVDLVRTELAKYFSAVGASDSFGSRMLIQLLAAALGASAAATVRVPQEVLKQGIMAQLYPNTFSATHSIWTTQGWRGFYNGLRPTLLRDVLWNSLSFTIFKLLDEIFSPSAVTTTSTQGEDSASSTPKGRIVAQYWRGIVAGALAALLTHPLDVFKTRVMTTAIPPRNIFELVQSDGIFVLSKGLVPRLFYLGPLASLVLATNEVIASFLLSRKQQQH